MSEFETDEQRDRYVAALLHEHSVHETRKAQGDPRYNEADHEAVAAELKRLKVDPKKAPAASAAAHEVDGEFATPERRAAYIEALKNEYAQADAAGNEQTKKDVKAELDRLTGTKKKAKTQAELDEKAAADAEADREELKLNPKLAEELESEA